MHKNTIPKMSKARPGTHFPTEGGKPARQTNADIGAITKGSSGAAKAEKGRNKRVSRMRNAGITRANQTTSTSFPKQPIPKDFLNKLGEMHTGERELTLALPLVAKAAKSKDLKKLLNIHLKETRNHLKALDHVAQSLGEELPSRSCKPMTKLIGEGVKVIGKRLVSSNQDAELIRVGRKIEQFEISSYGPLCATAEKKDWAHELALLTSILNQEKLANELLGDLADGSRSLREAVERRSLKHAGAGRARAGRRDTRRPSG